MRCSPQVRDASFEAHVEQVMLDVRGAFARIIDALPGHVTRAHQVQKALGIDKKLGWRVFNVAHGNDAFAAAQLVPGPAAAKTFLRAVTRAGLETDLVESAAKALAKFNELISVHAGDRASLEMMVGGHAGRGGEQAELSFRRAAFRGNSFIWGVQAKTQFKADFLHPAAEEGRLDIASLKGFIGLRRLRPNVSWVIARVRCTDDDGVTRRGCDRMALDPEFDEAGGDEVPLLREFCSKPLPKLRRINGDAGFLEDELVEAPVGNTAAITCITGELSQSVASYRRAEHNRWSAQVSRMRTPCEVLVFDQFVHEDLFGRIEPELAVFGDLGGGPTLPVAATERVRIPVSESVEYLGKGLPVIYTPDVPRYADMARYVFSRLGWDSERFDVYRVRMAYPPIPTSVVMRHELRDGPG